MVRAMRLLPLRQLRNIDGLFSSFIKTALEKKRKEGGGREDGREERRKEREW